MNVCHGIYVNAEILGLRKAYVFKVPHSFWSLPTGRITFARP